MESMKKLSTFVLVVLLTCGAVTRAAAESSNTYNIPRDSQGRCLSGWGIGVPPSSVVCQDGAPFFRADTTTWYASAGGSWSTATFTLTALTAPTITAPTITGITVDPTTTAGVGTVSGTGVSVVEGGNSGLHKTTFTLANTQVITDAGAAGAQGGTKIYTFPEGVITILGVSCNATTLAGAGGIADGAATVHSLGTVTAAVDNATLTSTEADIIASFAGTMTTGAGAFTKYGAINATPYDGHTTAIAVFLNSAVPDADSSASDTITFAGSCTLLWSTSGDF